MSDDIVISVENGVGRISLNRPQAIHALNLAMCEAMTTALLLWQNDDSVKAVILDHAEGRGFCAGGDIRMLAESGAKGGEEARHFFHTEYRLNHLLFSYPKPIAAFMDGITMGGGVGLALPAKYRVATENTRFAMPEAGIGLFPDVGGGWFLPRLEGRVGVYLALTGARIKGPDCLALGLATHYIAADALDDLKAAITANPADLAKLLDEAATDALPADITADLPRINSLFASDRLEDIIAALRADGSEWAAKQLENLLSKSPQTCKVTLRQLAEGAQMTDFADQMAQEYAIGARVVTMHDFIEGVRALIIDKDHSPRWNPASAEEVSDEWINAIFAPLPENERWTPLD
jgi:enoyl-CoA hydratase